LTSSENNVNLHKVKIGLTGTKMAKSNTENFNRDISAYNSPKVAHEVLANLLCKYEQQDTDQDQVLKSLESEKNFDPVAYAATISKIGSKIYEKHQGNHRAYIKATHDQERDQDTADSIKHHAANYPNDMARKTFQQTADALEKLIPGALNKKQQEIDNTECILEETGKDVRDFKKACRSLEGKRKEIAINILGFLDEQYNSMEMTLEYIGATSAIRPKDL
jgi:hypothetical protein